MRSTTNPIYCCPNKINSLELSFGRDDYQTATYAVDQPCSMMSSYEITDEEILNLEQATQLWSVHRAGM